MDGLAVGDTILLPLPSNIIQIWPFFHYRIHHYHYALRRPWQECCCPPSPSKLLHSFFKTSVRTAPLKHKSHHGTALLQLATCPLHFKVPTWFVQPPTSFAFCRLSSSSLLFRTWDSLFPELLNFRASNSCSFSQEHPSLQKVPRLTAPFYLGLYSKHCLLSETSPDNHC